MLRVRVHARGFRRAVHRMLHRRKYGRERALRDLVGIGVQEMVRIGPRDTNRYVAGWARAARAIGVRMAVPPIVGSKRARQNRQRLLAQADRIIRTLRGWYGSEDTPTKRKPDKTFWKLRRALDRAMEQIEKFEESALVIGGRANAKTVLARLATIRTKVYGGTGRILSVGSRSVAQLRNLEPHASIVERKKGVVRDVARKLRGRGIRRVGRKYVSDVVKAGGR